MPAFLVDRLIDRQDPHIAQDRVADELFDAAGLFRRLVAARQHDIDAIVGQNEAAGAGFRRNLDGDGAHAFRQHGGHEARALGHHHIGIANGIACHHGDAHDRAGEIR